MDRRTFAKNLAAAALLPLASQAGAAREEKTSNAARGEKTLGEAEASNASFKISIMLWTVFRDLPIEQRLEKVAEAGYGNVELVGEHKKWSDDEWKGVNARRKQLGISFDATAGLKYGMARPGEQEAMLAALRDELVSMEKIECPALIVMSGNVVPGMPREVQHESCIEALKKAAGIIEGRKINGAPVRLLLETIDPEENPNYYLTSMNEGFEIVKAVNHPQVQMLYDFFHEQIAEGNLIEKLERNIEHVGLAHVADVPGRHEPGSGEINYENIFRKLGELHYDHMVAMEFKPTGDPVRTLREARERALAAVRA